MKRFHVDIYCPEWSRDSILEFTKRVSAKRLVCSFHATKRYKLLSKEYQRAVKKLIESIDLGLAIDYIFEFYANKKNEIKKVCYRFPMTNLDSDVILVISSTGKIVTIFLNRNFDPHVSLDRNLYEQEKVNEISS